MMLDARVLGVTVGCCWGTFVFLVGLVSRLTNSNPKIIPLFAKVYIGYKNTVPGSLIGAAWGFIDGVISGMLAAWLYNRIIF